MEELEIAVAEEATEEEVEEEELLALWVEEGEIKEAETLLDKLETLLYFSTPYDSGSAILSIHSGQGGTEAMDWAEMLFRMYTRYFERKGWSYDIIDKTMGEEAGIKSISMTVSGSHAYGYLKHEAGVHRLVRLSPFNADNLRQTSFSMVEVLPLIEQTTDVDECQAMSNHCINTSRMVFCRSRRTESSCEALYGKRWARIGKLLKLFWNLDWKSRVISNKSLTKYSFYLFKKAFNSHCHSINI
jgi:hypothetical protein